MINLKTKFEGSSNCPCAKRNEELRGSRRVCESRGDVNVTYKPTENSKFLANQTGCGRVRMCYCEDSFYQERVWSWNKTEVVWRGKMIHGRRQQNKRNSRGQTGLDNCGRNSTKIRTLKLFYNINGGCHN